MCITVVILGCLFQICPCMRSPETGYFSITQTSNSLFIYSFKSTESKVEWVTSKDCRIRDMVHQPIKTSCVTIIEGFFRDHVTHFHSSIHLNNATLWSKLTDDECQLNISTWPHVHHSFRIKMNTSHYIYGLSGNAKQSVFSFIFFYTSKITSEHSKM